MAKAAGELAATLEMPLVSGYAKGVDMAGHIASVAAGGKTVAVLAEGIGQFRVHRDLQSVIEPWDDIWDQLTIVSQFEDNARWTVWRAMQRNDTICTLGRVLVAIDPGEKGGTFDAVKKGVKRGMPVVVGWTDDDSEPSHLEPLLRQPSVSIVKSIQDLESAIEDALEAGPQTSEVQLTFSLTASD